MRLKNVTPQTCQGLNIDAMADLILRVQNKSGEIPWHSGGKTDPWDLVEAAMGLNIAGYYAEAERAFEWLKNNQNPDGSWYSSYLDGNPLDKTKETNMSAYIATGVFQTWLIRQERSFLERLWPTIKKAINFSISLQTERGEIYWAKSPKGVVDPMALLTGSSSIYMSLKTALAIASILEKAMPPWETACIKLGNTIKNSLHLFNISKSRYSMYWFYPVLTGALTGEAAARRIEKQWKKYVIDGQGVRCVSDQPWITMAETSELVLALSAMGRHKLAKIVFSWIQDRVYGDGTFWCGYTFPDMVIWPEEKITWTNAVALMAADALFALTPAARLFSHTAWDGHRFKG